ncbi:Gfo/Idh/MocA family protein [Thalassococcus sp. S3]|uniref:Gfo/Idh/MocA family protein n=1 Tax=Thalassococcus sp. S3 TaxID=2017482 RepID=UPI0010244121|nr:Gfo/Idh/MocA family oxidoreductase [Thalassococcus sp. S3]QBF34283.1 oxidoreductase [Thalassococcus sp. S3]
MIRIGVVGAGLIGAQHIRAISSISGIELGGVVDPMRNADPDLPWVADIETLMGQVDGVILAVPNDLHAPLTLKCIDAGLPVLVEKPLAGTVEDGDRMVKAAEALGIPLLVGHHRRHAPRIAKAKALLTAEALGRLTTIHGQCWLPKPASYFKAKWRSGQGAGPLFINLIHDVDLLMHLCGPIVRVQAMESNAVRGAEVEETVVVSLRFTSGALGSLNLSDAALGPWSWELTAGENPAYPMTGQSCYWIGGTHGALSLPDLTQWRQEGGPDWWAPMSATRVPVDTMDPLVAQIAHFAEVIQGNAQPLVTGADGLRAVKVIHAIKQAARSGRAVDLQ